MNRYTTAKTIRTCIKKEKTNWSFRFVSDPLLVQFSLMKSYDSFTESHSFLSLLITKKNEDERVARGPVFTSKRVSSQTKEKHAALCIASTTNKKKKNSIVKNPECLRESENSIASSDIDRSAVYFAFSR